MKYTTVIWDFDGTLADTLGGALEIYNDLAAQYGFDPIDDPETVRSMPLSDLASSHNIPLRKVPVLVRSFLKAQRLRMSDVRLCAGVYDVLLAFRELGCRQGIVSSNAEDNIRTCLRANGAEDFFEFIIGYSRMTGKQRALRRVIRQLELTPEAVLYIGDDVRDVRAAKTAGADIAAVSWGISARQLLEEHQPDYLVDSPTELLALQQ
ncbi:MAG: HAD-IA family hydrolase [Planctomycetes bacterium]|nr:HAD-IA family hydrolase [Planctomycetota bacterium]